MLKNWCFWTVVLEQTLESPLDCKEIKPVDLKGNQCWIFIGRTDAEAEAPIFWPPHVKSWLIRKDPDAGKDWGQEEYEHIEWHNSMDMSVQTLGDSVGQGSLVFQSMGSWRFGHNWATEQQLLVSLLCFTDLLFII